MQSAGNDDFKETKTILKELESLFSKEDIQYDVDDINKMRKEIDLQTSDIIGEYQAGVKSKCSRILFIYCVIIVLYLLFI